MKKLAAVVVFIISCHICWENAVIAQGRGATDWMTSNSDAQRSSWVRTDAKISRETMQKPGFQFLWKLNLKNEPKGLNSLTPPALMERLIGYRGFRMLGFVGGSADKIFVIDTDLGRIEWEKQLASAARVEKPTPACPGGMTANVTRPTATAISSLVGGTGSGLGRSGPARSSVGEPGQGAVTLRAVATRPAARPAGPAPAPSSQSRRGPTLIYALASDGRLHIMHLSNGADYQPPVKFLPPNANAQGLIVIDNMAYVVTEGNCGGVPNGVWALDIASKRVTTWKGNVSGSAGPAFDDAGTLYVTTRNGGQTPNSLVALDPETLTVKGRYTAGDQGFSSSPIIFKYKLKTLIAATTSDGRIHLLDSAGMIKGETAVNQKPFHITPAEGKALAKGTGALASWEEANGTRWILAPAAGAQSAGAPGGAPTSGAIVAWKVVEQNGMPVLQQVWRSRDLVSPLPPTIINEVVFVTSSGEFRSGESRLTRTKRAQRSSGAVLYALDGTTGKELWNSGTTITSFTRGAALSGGVGQIYVGDHDSVFYAFGFPMEH
jgi:outer membrane protein assembly factor BamB